MSIKYGSTTIQNITYNNTDISLVYYNNTIVFCKPYVVNNVDHIEIELDQIRLTTVSSSSGYSGKSAVTSRNASYSISGTTVTMSISNNEAWTSLRLTGSIYAILKDKSKVLLYKYGNNNLTPKITATISNFTYSGSDSPGVSFDCGSASGASSTLSNGNGSKEETIATRYARLVLTPKQNNQSESAKFTFSNAKINNVSKSITIVDSLPA